MNPTPDSRQAMIIRREQGRRYEMGRMQAVFFADDQETAGRYSISEWWLQPRTTGPGSHAHPEDHIYYVLTGRLSLLIAGARSEAPQGSYVLIPGGVSHDFENRGDVECGFISLNAPGGFEAKMPDIVAWFALHPPGEPGDGDAFGARDGGPNASKEA